MKPTESTTQARKEQIGHLIRRGVFGAPFHVLSRAVRAFEGPRRAAGQIFLWIIISMDKWGEEDRSLR